LSLIDFYDTLLNQLELFITCQAKQQDQHSFYLLRSVPGIGKILALTILYEIHDIARFPRVQEFVSYCRLVKCSRQSAGKNYGFSGKKIGNAHLKWAFSEAAVLFLRHNPEGQNSWLAWSANMEKPKLSPSWLTSWRGLSISSYEGRKPLT
jgi:transposase